MNTPTAQLEMAIVYLHRAKELCASGLFMHDPDNMKLLATVERGAIEVKRRFIAERDPAGIRKDH